MGKWSTAKENRVGEKLAVGLTQAAIENANRNPGNAAAERLANEMCDTLQRYRRTGEVPE